VSRNRHRLSGAVAATPRGGQINRLASVPVVLVEHRYASRADRRHIRSATGALLNIPKARQAPGLNEPYRKPKPDLVPGPALERGPS
jgi:hypothetical protein